VPLQDREFEPRNRRRPALIEMSDAWFLGRARELIAGVQRLEHVEQLEIVADDVNIFDQVQASQIRMINFHSGINDRDPDPSSSAGKHRFSRLFDGDPRSCSHQCPSQPTVTRKRR